MSEPRSGHDQPALGARSPAERRSGEAYPGPLAYAGFGMLNAFCLLGGGALGWLADTAAGTLPIFMFFGLVAGAALGVAFTRAEWRRLRR
jgi:hypothetical protein